MICYPVLSFNIARHLEPQNCLLLDMSSRPRLGSHSSPPIPTGSIYFEVEGPPPEALLAPLQPPQLHPPLPQAVLVKEAPVADPDATFEYVLESDDPGIASNAVVLVDATMQWSRPSSRPGSAAASPRPVIGVRISGVVEALITAATPVYAARSARASPPPPPPLYADSAARVVRRPPPVLLVQRPRTRSTVGDGPLFEPLLGDSRCFK